ncbi:PAQR family membrane homeostasis protein TrhA [Yinghuangia seranimata]|uniref:PAQR family membrane homeostasis protein TrhA n=1 Tax=Yinghuangia seranimata TaxID=408067 RepID=UPI00248AECF1|nr:hemolysin III family protein [Yinghuangia seranimata]MDI2128840.1 hemolysin III family protein [Yinghuangia seranimata]
MSLDVHALAGGGALVRQKPKLRGWLHAGTFPVAVAGGIVLVSVADSTKARLACAVFALTAAMLFGTSGLYHRGNWGPRGEAVLRRLDHANIFLIIAGTYTPFSIILFGVRSPLLWVVWGGALAGICFRVFWISAPRWLYTPVYVALGWAAVFYIPDFLREGGVAVLVLIIVGGALYSIGAVVYGLKRPDPSPHWFGFHEVFHAFTLAAFTAHYIGVSIVAYSH